MCHTQIITYVRTSDETIDMTRPQITMQHNKTPSYSKLKATKLYATYKRGNHRLQTIPVTAPPPSPRASTAAHQNNSYTAEYKGSKSTRRPPPCIVNSSTNTHPGPNASSDSHLPVIPNFQTVLFVSLSVGELGMMAVIMEAVSTSEASVDFDETTRCNISEDTHLHIRHRKNLKPHLLQCVHWWS
jgi:hypothetical protein